MSNFKLSIEITRNKENTLYTFRIYDIEHLVNFHSYDCVYFAQGYDYNEMIENIKKSKFKNVLKDFHQNENLIENDDYEKGFQDAIEKAKQIIISYMPLPSHKNHNMNYDVELLEERQKYAHQVAEKFEEMMNTNEK